MSKISYPERIVRARLPTPVEPARRLSQKLGVPELTDQIELSLEGFYKDLDQLVSRSAQANGSFLYDNQGSGYVIGAETPALSAPPGLRERPALQVLRA